MTHDIFLEGLKTKSMVPPGCARAESAPRDANHDEICNQTDCNWRGALYSLRCAQTCRLALRRRVTVTLQVFRIFLEAPMAKGNNAQKKEVKKPKKDKKK